MRELEALAGAVLCVGLPDASRFAELAALAPGGVIVFGRSAGTPEATCALVGRAREAVGGEAPVLGCVDQEGGRVARLRAGFAEMPAMLALGAADDAALAERAGAALASDVRRAGLNVDFAPVLDLGLEPRSTVIGTRALGDDPARVGELGAALVRGFAAGGVAAVPKHFPGHGATALDSHTAAPAIDTDAATLRARDLAPFRAAFAAGAPAVMTAHVVVRALDPLRPATLSHAVLSGLLREELGFAGVCFTDCLEMAAVARSPGTAEAAVLALAAGADALVVSHDLGAAFAARDAIVAAVRSGALAHERLARAAARVDALRARFAGGGAPVPGVEAAAAVGREVATASIAVLRGDVRLDPAAPVTVVSFEGDAGDGVAAGGERPSLSLALRRRKLRSEAMRVPLDPAPGAARALAEIVALQPGRQLVVATRRAHLHDAQARGVRALLAAFPDAVLASLLEPADVACFPAARRVACTFGDGAASLDALADVLAGTREARGRSPVRLGA